jgi:outer membrane protein assembly factor BamB
MAKDPSSPSALYAIMPDGTKKWSLPGGGRAAVAADGTLYVLAGADMCAIGADGAVKWTLSGPFEATAPVIGANGVVFVTRGGSLWAINPDGTTKWKTPKKPYLGQLGSPQGGAPAVGGDGTIYVGTEDGNEDYNNGRVYAIRPDGTPRWSVLTDGNIYNSSPVLGADGTIYVVTYAGGLHAIGEKGKR